MKYKMFLENTDYISIGLVNEEKELEAYNVLVWFYWSYHLKEIDSAWPEGFWLNPKWGEDENWLANKDYHEHRDEYIAEGKKLLIKEML